MAKKPLQVGALDALAEMIADKLAVRLAATSMPPADDPVIFYEQACASLGGCHRTTVHRLIQRGLLPEPGMFGGRRGWLKSQWNAGLRKLAADTRGKAKARARAEAALDGLVA
jgi:predicted DNA-binding transcriptional regulator AlpA